MTERANVWEEKVLMRLCGELTKSAEYTLEKLVSKRCLLDKHQEYLKYHRDNCFCELENHSCLKKHQEECEWRKFSD